jgi:hypothetical protein
LSDKKLKTHLIFCLWGHELFVFCRFWASNHQKKCMRTCFQEFFVPFQDLVDKSIVVIQVFEIYQNVKILQQFQIKILLFRKYLKFSSFIESKKRIKQKNQYTYIYIEEHFSNYASCISNPFFLRATNY